MKICLLQGPFSPLMSHISSFFTDLGHEVFRYSFCNGDFNLCRSDKTSEVIEFRGLPCEWEESFDSDHDLHGFQIVLGHGDCHFYNEVAFKVCKRKGTLIYVSEEGYFRPDYITLEQSGVNANSPMMNCDFNKGVPYERLHTSPLRKVSANLIERGYHCVSFYLLNLIDRRRYPFYRHRRSAGAAKEVYSWIKTACSSVRRKHQVSALIDTLCSSKASFYLVPLQVYCDSQIVRHSSYDDMVSFIKEVMESFLKSAPKSAILVFKHHPYCLGFSDYTRVICHLGDKYGVAERIVYLRGGHLPTLLKVTEGVITINSTVGLNALHHNVPTYVAGSAFFNKQSVTYQGELDDFWNSNFKPDPVKVKRLTNYIKHSALVNASLYSDFKFSANEIVNTILFEVGTE
ncbi:Capsular polysaccharide export system protein KpsS [Vibrio chagasii]|nr:Capsular polysaccharide export system protein KpsS [Vibrio chagasii]